MVVFLILRWLSSMVFRIYVDFCKFLNLCAPLIMACLASLDAVSLDVDFCCRFLEVVHTLNLWQWNLGFVDFASCIV
ncbi:unnamed protein product [Rhizophagus irregularis]|nr:unnamed protein product [Rhizophagus irregularis]